MSKFFIDRPIFTFVIAAIITILGAIVSFTLPISQYPKLVPPTVIVSANYPGADAQTIANEVLGPLETQIQGAPGLTYMSGTANGISGQASVICTYDIGTNADDARTDILNRINQALPIMPSTVTQLGVNTQIKNQGMLLIIGFTSPDNSVSPIDMSNYVYAYILPQIQMIKGAGMASIFGQQDYAMRVWLNPDKMQDLNITATDISTAIKDQNIQVAPGRLGQSPTPNGQMWTMTLVGKGRLNEVPQFEKIILRANKDGSFIRLSDVARVELGTNNYETGRALNGKDAVLIGVPVDPNANSLQTVKEIRAKLDSMAKTFPPGVAHFYPNDTSVFVDLSIKEVVKTLFEAIVFVVLIIYLFLQNWRATIIPVVTIPISIFGAFIGMYIFGYTINTLTLFALVLAIGLVVDDAIVVVENMERIMGEEPNLSQKEVAIKAIKQVSSPVIATVLVLCAVFIPASILGGMTGLLYKQFAIIIVISIVVSGFLALTLAPAMGALLLKPNHKEPAKFFRWFNARFEKMTFNYLKASNWLIKRTLITLALYLAAYVAIFQLNKTLPTAFLPTEDQGYLIASVNLPDGASLERTKAVMKQVGEMARTPDGVQFAAEISGLNIFTFMPEPNSGVVFIRFHDWDKRKSKELSMFGILGGLQAKFNQIKDARVFAMPPSPIPGIGQSNMFQYHVLAPGDNNISRIAAPTQALVQNLREDKRFTGAMTTMAANTPQLRIDVNREKAKTLGVNIQDIFTTLQSTVGYMNINQFDRVGKTYWVQTQMDGKYRTKPEDIGRAWVRSNNGSLVPLSALITITETTGPSRIDHFNGQLTTLVMGQPASGYSSGELIKYLEEKSKQILPSTMTYAYEGLYYQEILVGSQAVYIMIFALIMVYLILAAQYENIVLPMAVMLAVPYGVLGAFTAVWVIPFLNNNVYFQIGLLVLIGLSAKNAILVVEYAEEARRHGKNVYDATMEAAKVRYRPMMMTSAAFVLGVLPLAIATGAGSMSRMSIGIAMLGGTLAATFIERYFIPVLYYWVMSLYLKFLNRKKQNYDNIN